MVSLKLGVWNPSAFKVKCRMQQVPKDPPTESTVQYTNCPHFICPLYGFPFQIELHFYIYIYVHIYKKWGRASDYQHFTVVSLFLFSSSWTFKSELYLFQSQKMNAYINKKKWIYYVLQLKVQSIASTINGSQVQYSGFYSLFLQWQVCTFSYGAGGSFNIQYHMYNGVTTHLCSIHSGIKFK